MDVITYIDDLEAFRAEAKLLAGTIKDLHYDEATDVLIYGVDKTPVYYNGSESVTLIRIENDSDLAHFDHIERLGECIDGKYIFDSEEAELIYTNVYDTTPYIVDEITITPPKMLGVFA